MTARLRPATIADVFRLQQIERAAAELFRETGLIDVDNAGVSSLSDHEGAITAGLSLVAEADGRVAGFVIGSWRVPDIYLHELDVDPDYQQRGIGAQLVRAFVSAARAKRARDIYLATFRDPPWNAPFYRRLGFEDVPRERYLAWMTAIEESQAAFLDLSTRTFMRFNP